ncbi:MAG: hypothetical protein BYD32DRAFT_411875 [Podila humilis]|nr:MAG: hypothetical protein BYD32DRAFT_411875 [Podila humilis]
MEKLPYIRQRKQRSRMTDNIGISLANLTIPESILNDTPYPDIASLGPAQKLTPEQVDKQRARGALRNHERAEKETDRSRNINKRKQGSIASPSSGKTGVQDNKRLSGVIGPQQQAPHYHPSESGLPTYSHVHGRSPYTPIRPSPLLVHLHAPWQQKPNIASSDPLPPGMSSLPQSLLVPETRPVVPAGPGATVPSRALPRPYSTISPIVQPPFSVTPVMSHQVGRKRNAEGATTDTLSKDKPRRMKKRGIN